MSISYSKLKKIAYFCLLLPSLIFVIGFLKWYIALPVTLALGAAYFFVVKDTNKEVLEFEEKTIKISCKHFFVLVGIVILWCWISGIGNFYYQSADWFARNAIFRDLIRFDWPVIYSAKNSALVYYIGYWLPAALIGKAFYGMTADLDVAWTISNMALLLWTAICLTVIILMVLMFTSANTPKKIWVALAIFIGFSGLDFVGSLVRHYVWGSPWVNHIEWWSRFQFSSIITCMGWVFNQSVLSWLAVICFMSEKKLRNYALIIVLALSSAPLPCVGLAIYMAGVGIVKLIQSLKEKAFKIFCKDVFTPQNIIAVVTLLPIYFFYYKTNLAVNVGQMEDETVKLYRDWFSTGIMIALVVISAIIGLILLIKKKSFFEAFFFSGLVLGMLIWSFFNLNLARAYLAFILLEGGLYLFFIWRANRREPLFYLTWIVMAICPLITVGTSVDFCMRASIPAVFILMVLCIKYLFDNSDVFEQKKINLRKITVCLLVVALVIGSFTGIREIIRGIDTIRAEGHIAVLNDWAYSMNRFFVGELEGTDRNFIASDYSRTFFFRYLAK